MLRRVLFLRLIGWLGILCFGFIVLVLVISGVEKQVIDVQEMIVLLNQVGGLILCLGVGLFIGRLKQTGEWLVMEISGQSWQSTW